MGIDFSKFSKDFKAKFEAAAADKKVSLKEFNTFSQQDQATLTALLNNDPDALGNIVVVNAEYKSNNGGIFETYLGQSSNGLIKISDEAKSKYKGAVDGWIENGEFTLRDASHKPIKNADGTDVKFVLKEKADTNFRLPLGSETVRKEVRKFMVSLLKEAYDKKENEFKDYIRDNQNGFSFKELGMELHDVSSAVKDNLTKIGIPMDRTSTREEISQNLYNKGIQLAELSGSIDNEENFNKLFNNYFGTDFNYESAYDYMYDCMEWNNKDVKDKLTFAQESNDKFSKTFDDLTKNNFKTVDDYIGNSEKAGELLDLAFNVALMHVGASSAFAKATQMAAKGGAEMAESIMVKTLGKEAAESTIGKTVSQATGIVSAQTTNAGLNAVGFQSTKAADLASEAIVTGKINTEKAEQIGMSIESLFKFGYVGGAISGPLGMQVKGMTTRLLNSEPILKRVLTGTVTNKPIPLTSVLKNLSEHSEALGTVLKFGTEFGINAGYMAYDEGISYEDALKNLAQMDGVSKMVVAMLGGKNLEFLTPKKIQQIKTDLAGYKVNVAIKDGQKIYSVKDTKGQETILSTPEELMMFILDKEATTLGIKGNDAKPTETSSQKTETDKKVEAEKVEAKAKTETKNDVNKTKKTYQRPELEVKSLELQDDLMANTELKPEDFKVERIGTYQNKCGVLVLKNSNGEKVGDVNYDLREVNGQKVLHFEGLKSNISGAGVGSKLVQELVNLSKELGAEGRVVATASPMMSPNGKLTNMGFYYKLGFKATDATKDAEIRQLLAEGKEIPISLNVFTNIELTPEGIVRNTLKSKEAKKLEPMQKQYPEIANSIIEEYAGKLTNEEIIEKIGNAISEKINETLPPVQIANYTPKVEIEMPINETRFDNGNKTLDVNLPDGVTEGVTMPTKIKAELGTTSIHLANEYKEALDTCVEQAQNTFGATKLSTVKEVSTRPKGAASIEPKLEKGLRKSGHLDYNAAKECIGDAVGARIITKNLRKLSDKEITDRINNMKVDNKLLTTEQKELLKKYIYEEKFDSDAKKLEGFYLYEQFTRPLVEERTSEVVNELLLSMTKSMMIKKGLTIEQIEKEGILTDKNLLERLKTDNSIEPLEVLQVNNYTGLYGLPEFTVEQISAIENIISRNNGIVYTRADIGDNLYTNTGYTSPEEVLKANNGDKLPKSIKSSGYRTAQMNVVFKNGTLGEIQYRGEETNKIGEYEHIAYDLRQGKNTLGPLFNDFKEAISKLSPEEYSEYNNYLEACYNYYNRIELGLPANKPKLPSKFNPILSEENMKELHDKNEARLKELKKDFKEGKIR